MQNFTRLEIDLPADAARVFAVILAEYNAKCHGEPFTPSELAASILLAVLEDTEDNCVDLRGLRYDA